MGVRFSGTFKPYIDDGFQEVDVEIQDLQSGGSHPIRIEALRLYSEGDPRDPMTIINPQRCELVFLIEDAIYESFITDLGSSVTDRFFIVVRARGSIIFAGIVVHDFVEYADAAYPFPFAVSAVDGLTRMRDIDYFDESLLPFLDEANENFISCKNHIFNCFAKLNLDNIYTDAFDSNRVWIQMNWFATNMANTTDNPLEQAYVPSRLFYDRDNEGNVVSKSCYQVFESILTNFGLRCEYGRGIYRIEQVSERLGGPLAQSHYWLYDSDGSLQGERNQSWNAKIDQTNRYTAANGRFGFLPALRQVKVLYEYPVEAVAVEPDIDSGFGLTGTGKVCYTYTGGATLRPVQILAGDDIPPSLVFRVHFQLYVKTLFTGAQIDWLRHRFHIRVYLGVRGSTTSYVYRRFITGYDPVREEPSWVSISNSFPSTGTMAVGGWDYVTDALPWFGTDGHGFYYDVGFETTPFPESGTDIAQTYLCVELVDLLVEDGNNSLPVVYTNEWAISDLKVIAAKEDQKAKATIKEQEFKSSINEGGKDSKEITIQFSDKGGTLKVDDGSSLVEAGGWGVGAGGSLELGQLLANEYHKVRGEPIYLMHRTVIGRDNTSMDNLNTFDYCDRYWAAMITEHDFYTQEIGGSWWALSQARSLPSGSTQTKKEVGKEYNRIDNPKSALTALDVSEALGIDGDGFVAPTTSFVFTDGVLPDITKTSEKEMRRKVDVYRNGTKLHYFNRTPVGPTEFTINNGTNAIVLDADFPLTERHRIWVKLHHG